jgi:exonuclease V gamma subunit
MEPSKDGPAGQKSVKTVTVEQIRQILDALAAVGEYGEVHLIIQHGELRYINRVVSHQVLKNTNSIKPDA